MILHPYFALLVSNLRHEELVAAAEEFRRARPAGQARTGPARPGRKDRENGP